MDTDSLNDLLRKALVASVHAGDVILGIYESENCRVDLKKDNSPVTLADRRSNAVICDMLRETGLPVLSEEAAEISYETRKSWTFFWLVDPLDGTREFINRNGEFTVNIALVNKHSPVLGVVYTPLKRVLYFGSKPMGSYRVVLPDNRELPVHLDDWTGMADRLPLAKSRKGIRIVASRSHMSPETLEYIRHLRQKHKNVEIVSRGSSMKICMVAEGEAEYYPRLGPTMEWDTAAGQVIAEAAGCSMTRYGTTNPVVYNKTELLNPWFVVKAEDLSG
ncbi:MAG: 3'(2'),5'-bisphosphate nucleotidase CysQ [Bacteroidales bacterium]|nr:MAG: 3'(2'),5'-bisphosphate nucleotidase CysQ [Bacteroidales bacterium]